MKLFKTTLFFFVLVLISCSEESTQPNQDNSEANLIIKLKFDPNQERLDNFGQPTSIPEDNAAQSPSIRRMSVNYIELAPQTYTLLGEGEKVFEGLQTDQGGEMAIDFQNAIFAGNEEQFLSIPLSEIQAGNYNWIRVSLAYQEGDIVVLAQDGNEYTGTLASFVGYNTYISTFNLNGSEFVINENKLQGFWAYETLGYTFQGQVPVGATTVPNPLFDSSPIPEGSCVVTGQFENGFTITGNETEDVVVTLSFSTNNSFEWAEINPDGKYEPSIGENVVDMGIRGLIPLVE